jgi:hypothetical protein
MRLKQVGIIVAGLILWFAATAGIAFGVTEWRQNETPEPNFFCRETFRQFLAQPTEALGDAVRMACQGEWPSN